MNREKLTDKELATLVDYQVDNSVTESGEYLSKDEKYLNYYNGEKVGILSSQEGRSSVISTDVMDLVESDMPSITRVFLGAGDPVAFKPVRRTREAIEEVKLRQAYVSHIIKTIPNSFRTQHAWLKASELQQISALEYGCEEKETTKEKVYQGITEDELAAIVDEIESDPDVSKVEVVETTDEDEPELDVSILVTYNKKEWYMRFIPSEDFLISRNSTCKDDAELVGKRFRKTRGQLVADGLSKDFVDSLPSMTKDEERTTLKSIRYKDQGGEDAYNDSYLQWANQEVEGVDVCVMIDYDGDGISERRHVIKVGNKIIENEPFDHVNYALISSMLMPANVAGVPRAELAIQYQEINSVLMRQTLDNIYSVNNPRHAINDNVDVDDFLDIQLNGLVRTDNPQTDIMPLVTPFIGDKSLQVVAFMDGKKQVTTGANQANQALQADNLHKETATRFDSMEQAATAKIELIARVIAETGYKELWEGIAWFAKHYQDTDLEMRVLGQELTINPSEWKYDHTISAQVGTGAGDDEKTIQNLQGVLQLQMQAFQMQSPLVDQSKIYNTMAQIVKAIGKDSVEDYFNNPEQPDQMVEAERDMLKKMVQQMEAMQQNPLAEAEQVKAEGQMQIKLMEQKYSAQLETMKMQQKQNEEITNLRADFEKQLNEMKFKYTELATKTRYDYDKLETENNNDIKGEGTE
jgi:hypothetical protein